MRLFYWALISLLNFNLGMKKIIVILIFSFAQSVSGQEILSKSVPKIIDIKNQKSKVTRFTSHDAFEYKDKSYIITSGKKIKLISGSNKIVENIPGQSVRETGYYHTNTFLFETNFSTQSTRDIKVKQIGIPDFLKNAKYLYLGFLQKEEIVNFYLATYNSEERKTFVYNITHNLISGESKSSMVFETAKNNDPLAFFKNRETYHVGFASSYVKGGIPIISYSILDIENKVKRNADEIEFSEFKKARITNFLISPENDLTFTAYYKKGKRNINDIYIMSRQNDIDLINSSDRKYSSKKKIFYGLNGDIKTTFLLSDNKYQYSELMISDLGLKTKTLSNKEIESFEKLRLNDVKIGTIMNSIGDYKITDLKVAKDGATLILLERSRIVSSDGDGKGSSYYYGPGRVLVFDKNNNFLNSVGLSYKMSFGYNRGYGLDFIPLDNSNIIVQTSKKFTRYNLDKDKLIISRKGDGNRELRTLSKQFKGNAEYFIQSDTKVYLVKITDKTKFRIQFIDVK